MIDTFQITSSINGTVHLSREWDGTPQFHAVSEGRGRTISSVDKISQVALYNAGTEQEAQAILEHAVREAFAAHEAYWKSALWC